MVVHTARSAARVDILAPAALPGRPAAAVVVVQLVGCVVVVVGLVVDVTALEVVGFGGAVMTGG